MADHSFEFESSLATNFRGRRRHTTPEPSQHMSISFSSSSSHLFSQYRTTRRRRNQTRTTPFATDDDRSWQGELSWQFEPTGWLENSNLGAALSPWSASAATAPSSGRSNFLMRSANDYYLSHTYGGFPNFTNKYHVNSYSSYDPMPSGRLELQSYAARENNESSIFVQSHTSGEHTGHGKSPILSTIKEGSPGNRGPLADEDNLSTTDYGILQDMDRQVRMIEAYRDLKQNQDPRWFSVSHAYINENAKNDHDHGMLPSNHHVGYTADENLKITDSSTYDNGHYACSPRQSTDNHNYRVDYEYIDHNAAFEEEDDGEEEAVTPKSVGLFSLFRYTTKIDLVLIFFGCLGALINGGSLPWYSFLFGRFVNNLANGQDSISKHQMMKEVEQVKIVLFIEEKAYFPNI